MKINLKLKTYTNPFNLYVLKLTKDKYYIGTTNKEITVRFLQHEQGNGTKWTQLYKPISIIETLKTSNKFDEDKWTKMYMNKYGIDNVRGGSYCQINLEDYQIKALKLELKTANNLCFKCGKIGHYASQCINNSYNNY